jgi:uncharacterized protein (DUF1684 family)
MSDEQGTAPRDTAPRDTAVEDARYAEEWKTWRGEWEAYVSRPHGWLAPVALHFPDATPQRYDGLPGLWSQTQHALHVDPEGTTMTYEGEPFTSGRSFDFVGEEDDRRIVVGDLEVGVTYRETYMLVVYDPQSARRRDFTGVPVFPLNPEWVLSGQFASFDSPKEVVLDSVSGRFTKARQSVGMARFEHGGSTYTVQVVEAFGNTTVSFNDLTNGVSTFPLVRWIPVSVPEGGGDGEVTLDFNRALNLPCAFSDAFPICPVPLASNRLPFAIEAGEKTPTGSLTLSGS